MKFVSAILLVFALASAPALAASDSGGYIGVEYGSSTLKNAAPFPNPQFMTLLGGYRFSRTIAAELGYTLFSETTASTSFSQYSLKLQSVHPAVVASFPVGDHFSVFGKIGISMNTENITNNLSGAFFSYKRTSNYYAVGAQFNLGGGGLSIRAQYETFGMFDNVPPSISASGISIGLIDRF